MARPPFHPTPEQRRYVETMSACGIPEEKIARVIDIDPKTLRKCFRRELDIGATKANTAVAQTAFRMATSGKCAAATIFWLKTRAGWRETTILEHTGPQGGPLEVLHGSLDERIAHELDRIAAARREEAVPGAVDADGKDGAGS